MIENNDIKPLIADQYNIGVPPDKSRYEISRESDSHKSRMRKYQVEERSSYFDRLCRWLTGSSTAKDDSDSSTAKGDSDLYIPKDLNDVHTIRVSAQSEMNNIELLKKNNYENKDIYISYNSIFKRKLILDDHIALDPFIYCASNLICRNYVHLSANINIIGGTDSYLYVGNFCGIAAGCNLCPGSSIFWII